MVSEHLPDLGNEYTESAYVGLIKETFPDTKFPDGSREYQETVATPSRKPGPQTDKNLTSEKGKG